MFKSLSGKNESVRRRHMMPYVRALTLTHGHTRSTVCKRFDEVIMKESSRPPLPKYKHSFLFSLFLDYVVYSVVLRIAVLLHTNFRNNV